MSTCNTTSLAPIPFSRTNSQLVYKSDYYCCSCCHHKLYCSNAWNGFRYSFYYLQIYTIYDLLDVGHLEQARFYLAGPWLTVQIVKSHLPSSVTWRMRWERATNWGRWVFFLEMISVPCIWIVDIALFTQSTLISSVVTRTLYPSLYNVERYIQQEQWDTCHIEKWTGSPCRRHRLEVLDKRDKSFLIMPGMLHLRQ